MPASTPSANQTKLKILEAARKEFGSRGFSGARVEAIARRAGVNKGLIFYYFESKEMLFRALAEERLSPQQAPGVDGAPPESPFDWSRRLFGLGEVTLDWVRFFLWEGLETGPGSAELLMEESRRQAWERQVERIREHQARGVLPGVFDPKQLTFFLYILGVYPYVVPQLAYLITGLKPTDERFQAEFEVFLRGLERILVARPGRDT